MFPQIHPLTYITLIIGCSCATVVNPSTEEQDLLITFPCLATEYFQCPTKNTGFPLLAQLKKLPLPSKDQLQNKKNGHLFNCIKAFTSFIDWAEQQTQSCDNPILKAAIIFNLNSLLENFHTAAQKSPLFTSEQTFHQSLDAIEKSLLFSRGVLINTPHQEISACIALLLDTVREKYYKGEDLATETKLLTTFSYLTSNARFLSTFKNAESSGLTANAPFLLALLLKTLKKKSEKSSIASLVSLLKEALELVA